MSRGIRTGLGSNHRPADYEVRARSSTIQYATGHLYCAATNLMRITVLIMKHYYTIKQMYFISFTAADFLTKGVGGLFRNFGAAYINALSPRVISYFPEEYFNNV